MSCGCSKKYSGCSKCSCTTTSTCGCSSSTTNCPTICGSVIVSNSWNVPACGSSAILSVAGLSSVLVGAYVWNPTYGWFRISAFDSVNGQITVVNDCDTGNASPGSVVPALTEFVFGTPPDNASVVVETGAWTVPACSATVVVDTPNISSALIGSYIWNPTYGWYRITAFNSTLRQMTLENDCNYGNSAPGTSIPANSEFIFSTPPDDTTTSVVTDSWTVPACAATVVAVVLNATSLAVGSYIWNTTYGWYRVTAFDPILREATLENDCTLGNSVAGTVVAADTEFVIGTPPIDNYFEWTDYVPTVTPTAPLTFTGSATILFAKYMQIGKTVFFKVSYQVTVNVPGAVMTMDLPVTAVSEGLSASCQITDGGVIQTGSTSIQTVNTIAIRMYDASNYTAGVVGPTIYGFYEVP